MSPCKKALETLHSTKAYIPLVKLLVKMWMHYRPTLSTNLAFAIALDVALVKIVRGCTGNGRTTDLLFLAFVSWVNSTDADDVKCAGEVKTCWRRKAKHGTCNAKEKQEPTGSRHRSRSCLGRRVCECGCCVAASDVIAFVMRWEVGSWGASLH
eukprot:TsM_000298300 transcript=TsM_000298300 gene=TsM_000298300